MSNLNPYQSPQANIAVEDESKLLSPAQGERLGSLHAVLLGVSACLLVGGQALVHWCFGEWKLFRVTPLFVLSVLVPSFGIAAILLAGVRRWQRRPMFPAHFGHWLLLIGGTNYLLRELNGFVSLLAIKAIIHKGDSRWELIANM